MTSTLPSANIIHGAREIARFVGKTERATFHLMADGKLPGAFKLGNSWALDVDLFKRKIEEQAA